jgi:hypothetical protein
LPVTRQAQAVHRGGVGVAPSRRDNGVWALSGDPDALFVEVMALGHDREFLNPRNGLVQAKRARWNPVFADAPQEHDYAVGKGRVVGWDRTPHVREVRAALPGVLGRRRATASPSSTSTATDQARGLRSTATASASTSWACASERSFRSRISGSAWTSPSPSVSSWRCRRAPSTSYPRRPWATTGAAGAG